MNEADFLANIAIRLGRNQPLAAQPLREVVGAPAFWTDYALPAEARIGKFQEELEKLGGHVEVFEKIEDLQAGLRELLQSLHPTRIGRWGGDALAEFNLDEILTQYEVLPWGESSIEEFEQVDVGLTGCAYAVADTGTLVMMSNALRGRSVSVLPSIHIVLIRASQIRTRLGEVLTKLSTIRNEMPSSVHFISGPSRSSDIENDQTIGVHGPAAVFALVLRDE